MVAWTPPSETSEILLPPPRRLVPEIRIFVPTGPLFGVTVEILPGCRYWKVIPEGDSTLAPDVSVTTTCPGIPAEAALAASTMICVCDAERILLTGTPASVTAETLLDAVP